MKTDEQVNLEILQNDIAYAKHGLIAYAEEVERLILQVKTLESDRASLCAVISTKNADIEVLKKSNERLRDRVLALIDYAYAKGSTHKEICDYVLKETTC